jgi:hypothetical protein
MVSAKLFTVLAASSVADNTTSNTPTCSTAVDDGQVVSLSDGKYKRCMSVITPSSNSGPMPVLFNFHGGGGSGRNCGEGPESGELASLAVQGGFALICGEALQGVFGQGGQWNVPEVITDATGTPCSESDSYDIAYINAAVSWLAAQGDVYDTSRLFFTGCSMGSAFTGYISSCWKQAHPSDLSSFATHSTGLKVKNDGTSLPPDNYNPEYTWGECPKCQYFPFKPESYSDKLGLKACIFDNTGDGDFYKTSVNLNSTWAKLGNRVETHFGSGGHCEIHSHTDIVNCMDDGTGRLLPNGPITPSPSPSPSPSPTPTPSSDPPKACQDCMAQACGGTPKQTDICRGCVHGLEATCTSVCDPYPFESALEWFCTQAGETMSV